MGDSRSVGQLKGGWAEGRVGDSRSVGQLKGGWGREEWVTVGQ